LGQSETRHTRGGRWQQPSDAWPAAVLARVEQQHFPPPGLEQHLPPQQQPDDGEAKPRQKGFRWPLGHRHSKWGKPAINVMSAVTPTCPAQTVLRQQFIGFSQCHY
jgi:hypothetical protein